MHIPDEDDKYEAIEKMPSLIETTREAVRGLSEIKDRLEGIDTIKFNKSKVLLMLQSIENNIRSVEEKASRLEQELLTALEDIRNWGQPLICGELISGCPSLINMEVEGYEITESN